MRKFTKDDFDKLRQTLAAHLSERLIPEPENRELILNLIHDVQTVAADRANQILYEELAKCPVVDGRGVEDGVWTSTKCEHDTMSARLVDVKELEGVGGMSDPVNHPPHYKGHPSGVECIVVTEHMNFCLGNAVKYIWRADLKLDAIEDLKKARWYLDREIERRDKK